MGATDRTSFFLLTTESVQTIRIHNLPTPSDSILHVWWSQSRTPNVCNCASGLEEGRRNKEHQQGVTTRTYSIQCNRRCWNSKAKLTKVLNDRRNSGTSVHPLRTPACLFEKHHDFTQLSTRGTFPATHASPSSIQLTEQTLTTWKTKERRLRRRRGTRRRERGVHFRFN